MQLVLLVGVVIDTVNLTRAELEEEYGDVTHIVEVLPQGGLEAFPTDRVLRDEMRG